MAVRLRPFSERETIDLTQPVTTANETLNEVTLIRGAGNRQQRMTFNFDSVFSESSNQRDVFDAIRPLVNDVLAGYEGTVFAYGQTGTGKTHTMEGNISSDEHKGVIPRAVEAIFEQLGKGKYVSSAVSASYLEIYNEELSDLLVEGDALVTPREKGANATNKPADLKAAKEKELKLGEDRTRGVFVQNLSEHSVANPPDVLTLLQRAQTRRQVGETKMNKMSSRSHCVFTLSVTAKRATSDGGFMETTGKLHLVDLAGSECAKTAAGDAKGPGADARERERKNINQSLLTLGRVISTLRESMSSKKVETARIPCAGAHLDAASRATVTSDISQRGSDYITHRALPTPDGHRCEPRHDDGA